MINSAAEVHYLLLLNNEIFTNDNERSRCIDIISAMDALIMFPVQRMQCSE